ncbi:sterol desaturase family protein [Reichenbachiella agarivorans]|uniref:Sterol desaturase family protein n=1 Tax=Reichenbachiella agarivorans TaxID=2979464 RepID=A0ABY6CUW6_9BACT|nr:sterol desaturase family protein [Reichenbachiella agarivorans]UXP33790.1 sterol desaturase family protein [Reichenbachiella agarivorans]
MEALLDFFAQVPTWFRASILVGGLMIFWLLEGVIPLFQFEYKKFKHAGLNLFLTLTTMVIGFGMAGLLLMASDYVSSHQIGLLYLVKMPLWLQVLLGILLMDAIGAYLVHLIEHKVRWMWKFHLVHHTDTHIDVTSGLRHHPGETVFRIGFTILAVLVIGAPISVVMLYQSLSVLFAHLTHANVSLFGKYDRLMSYILVTPDMHKVHHHYRQPWTDSNYGNIFSIWDRLFGTFAYVPDMSQLKYGIDTHMAPEENESLSNILVIPFQKYRQPLNQNSEVKEV